SWIAVSDVQLLVDHDCRNVRFVMATILVQGQSLRRSLKGVVNDLRAIGKRSLFDVDEGVGKFAILNYVGLGHQIWVLLSAGGISVGTYLRWRRRRAGESDSATNTAFISLGCKFLPGLAGSLARS